MKKLQIKTIFGELIFESKSNSISDLLKKAIKKDADLSYANLRSANLRSADLSYANLLYADLSSADLSYANLLYADLSYANLLYADLRSADLSYAKNIPESYINLCSRDMLFIFSYLKKELPGLKKVLKDGKIDGTCYKGKCACLIGTLANLDGSIDEVCSIIPFYEKGLHNYAEQWFWQIRIGDKPKDNPFVKHAVKLIDQVLREEK